MKKNNETYEEAAMLEARELFKLVGSGDFESPTWARIFSRIKLDAAEAEAGFQRVGDFVDQCFELEAFRG